jgi:hypothetical protein
MRLFVDTECTQFIDCDLISIGVVADDGREFYGERSDYDDASCSEFVRAAVLSQLAWLDEFAHEPVRLLCFDYSGDWELLCDLLDGPPAGWQACRIELDLARVEHYYRAHAGRHHALIDARQTRGGKRT